jgi:phosphatidate phosphatase PAH1
VEGVEDTGGRLYFPIPAEATLGVGRHRLHLVVKGDLSSTEQYIEVLPADTPVFVTDIDGTLTTFETEAFTDLLLGQIPDANPSSAEALTVLASKGIRPFYLTARPEWLMERTREFLAARGYPAGIAHTTLSKIGATGSAAVTYKTSELAALLAKGFVPTWAFGNTDSDATAYQNAGLAPLDHRIFFQFDDPHGGRRIDDYGELLGEFGALPSICP